MSRKNKYQLELRNKLSPFQLFNLCKGFANVLHFNLYSLGRRTELVELIRQNVESYVGRKFHPQSLRDTISEMVSLKYNHFEILETFKIIDQFFEIVFTNMFDLLRQNTKIHPLGKNSGINTGQNKSNNSFFK